MGAETLDRHGGYRTATAREREQKRCVRGSAPLKTLGPIVAHAPKRAAFTLV